MDVRFEKAMAMAGEEFMEMLEYYIKAWLPARSVVQEALDSSKEIDESGQILVLKKSCPWKVACLHARAHAYTNALTCSLSLFLTHTHTPE